MKAGYRLRGHKGLGQGRRPQLELLEQRQLLSVAPMPGAWSAIEPLASGIYERSLSDTVETGEPDAFTVDLQAGQVVSLVAEPAGGLRAEVALTGPDGATLATGQAASLGQSAWLQTVPIATTGRYTVSVSGLDSTEGGYALRALLNSAVETESIGGATNNLAGKAQNLDSAFVALGADSGSLAGVQGSAQLDHSDWYRFTLADGQTTTLVLNTAGAQRGLSLELYDETQTLVTTGSGDGTISIDDGSFIEQAIHNVHDVTSDGPSTYYVCISSTVEIDYSLVVTRDTGLDPVDQAGGATTGGDLDTAQRITGYLNSSDYCGFTDPVVITSTPDFDYESCGVQMSDDWVVIDATRAPDTADQKAIYVYRREGLVWTFHQRLIVRDHVRGLAIDGDTIVVGTYDGNDNHGSVHIFQFADGLWTRTAKFNGNIGDNLGYKVSVSGNHVLAAAPGAYTSDGYGGMIYSYTYDGTTWVQNESLSPSVWRSFWTVQSNWTLAIDGDVALVGREIATTNGQYEGVVCAFHFDGTQWGEETPFYNTNPSSFWRFGSSVAISGDLAIIADSARYSSGGQLHCFRRVNGQWESIGKFVPLDSSKAASIPGFTFQDDCLIVGRLIYQLKGDTWQCRGAIPLEDTSTTRLYWNEDNLVKGLTGATASSFRYFEQIDADRTQSKDYTVDLAAGDTFTASTSTPEGTPAELGENLAVVLRLRDASGTIVASVQCNAADGRNAQLEYAVTEAGEYTLEIEAVSGTQGRYVLTVGGSRAEPTPFTGTLIPSGPEPENTVVHYCPGAVSLVLDAVCNPSTVSVTDFLIDGVPVPSAQANSNGIVLGVFDLADGEHVFEVVGEIYSLDGRLLSPVAPLVLTLVRSGPLVTVDPLVTDDTTPALSGTVANPAATVGVTVNGRYYDAQVHGDGTWTIADNVIQPLGGGTYNISAYSYLGSTHNADTTYNELTITSYSGVIAGTVWLDTDGDGVWGASEMAIFGLVLYLDANRNGQRDAGETRCETNAAGEYAFTGLPAGEYCVCAEVSATWEISPSELASGWYIDLAANEEVHDIDRAYRLTTLDFGEVVPAGSLVRQKEIAGSILQPGYQSVAFGLEGGQTFTAVLHPVAGLQARVDLLAPDGTVLASASAGSPGAEVVLPLTSIAAADGYTLAVSGLNGTTGAYTATLWLNTAMENESYGGPANDSAETAESIASSFVALGFDAAQRGAVMGSLAAGTADWYTFVLDAGQTAALAVAGESIALDVYDASGALVASGVAAEGGVAISELTGPASGCASYWVRLTGASDTTYGLVVTRDAALSTYRMGTGEPQPLASTGIGLGYLADGGAESWALELQKGDLVVVSTATPGSGPGALVSDLDPKITIYTPAGAVLECDTSSLNNRDAKLTFVAPRAGTYRVEVAAETGGGEYVVKADVEASSAAIGGVVFNDLNGNGVRDEGEEPLEGWTVELEPVFHYAGHHGAWWSAEGHSLVIQNNRAIISQSENVWQFAFVDLVDITTGQVLQSFSNPERAQGTCGWFGKAVAFLGNDVLISITQDLPNAPECVLLYDGSTGELQHVFYDPSTRPNNHFGASLASDGTRFLVGAGDAAWLFDAATGELIDSFEAPDGSFGEGVPVALVGNYAYVAAPAAVYLYDVETGELLRTFVRSDIARGEIRNIAVQGDRLIVSQFSGDKVWTFNTQTGEELVSLNVPDPDAKDYFGMSLAVMGPWTLVGAPSYDDNVPGKVYWYDTETGELVRTLEAPESDLATMKAFGCALAADGYDILVFAGAEEDSVVYQFRAPRQADATVRSGSDGTFAFGDLAPGDYVVRGEAPTPLKAAGSAVRATVVPSGEAQREVTLAEGERVQGFDLAVFINEAPVSLADAYTCTTGKQFSPTALAGVLANDTDPNSQSLTAELVSGPEHGTLTLLADGAFTYVPQAGYVGTDQFTYRASDGELTSQAATVELTVAEPVITALGEVDFLALPDLDLSQIVGWWDLVTVRDGIFTLDVALEAGQDATLSLQSADGTPLATTQGVGGHFRIDQATMAGTAYRVLLEGTAGTGDLRMANLVEQSDTSTAIWGTAGDDTYQCSAATRVATINGVDYLLAEGITTVSFDGLQGADSATLLGTTGSDQATLAPGSATLSAGSLTATVTQTETILIEGAGGSDTAEFTDSAGADRYTGRQAVAVLAGEGFTNTARRFATVRVHGTVGSGDLARLDGTAGDELLVASPRVATFTGTGFSHQIDGMDQIRVFSKGGSDEARLTDGVGNDVFQTNAISMACILSDDSVLEGHAVSAEYPAYFVRTDGFTQVTATADPSYGDTDEAILLGSRANERLIAHADQAVMASDGFTGAGGVQLVAPYAFTVVGFDAVRAAGKGGLNDTAEFHGSAGRDVYVQERLWGRMAGEGFLNRAFLFDHYAAHATPAADSALGDVARLYETEGDDYLAIRDNNAQLDTEFWDCLVYDFAAVKAETRDVAHGGGGKNTIQQLAHDFAFHITGAWDTSED